MNTKSSKKGNKQQVTDDDELLDACIKANDMCSQVDCSKNIKVIGLKCNLCNNIYCTSHQLPEDHGCGKAAKKVAAASLKHCPSQKNQKDQHKELENKMSKKLQSMQNDRKKKGK